MRVVCLVLLLAAAVSGFYFPGAKPVDYGEKDTVPIEATRLTSTHTQLPYDYKHVKLCSGEVKNKVPYSVQLGQLLVGVRMEPTGYQVVFPKLPGEKGGTCNRCSGRVTPAALTGEDVNNFIDLIRDEYRVNLELDNLPAVQTFRSAGATTKDADEFSIGYPIGAVTNDNKVVLYNHLNILVKYHFEETLANGAPNTKKEKVRIVAFEVQPESFASDAGDCPTPKVKPAKQSQLFLEPGEKASVYWTYSVSFKEDSTRWGERWEKYFKIRYQNIHWYSIINSMFIVLFLSGMVAMIMMRTLHQDFRRFNDDETAEEAQEDVGWKLVHGDVFRPPQYPLQLAVLVGSGAQVFAMTLVTLTCAMLGFFSPANRGSLLTASLLLFVASGVFAGYFSARFYKLFKGQNWKLCTIATGLWLPGSVFAIVFILNLFEWGSQSSMAIPFLTMVELLALWLLVSLPMVFGGSYHGFKQPVYSIPVRTNQIPRQIPEQLWYMKPVPSILMGGILPFGSIFIEMFFILTSIWNNRYYYMFGFLFIVFVILIVTCIEITIVMCYFQLCGEDYHWWWRSFLTSGASTIYLFLYASFYFFKRLQVDEFVTGLLYFGYTTLLCLFFGLLTGSVGFYGCFVFVRKIYSAVKVD